jgi:hypothetical protein
MLRLHRLLSGGLSLMILWLLGPAGVEGATGWLMGRIESVDTARGVLRLDPETGAGERKAPVRLRFAKEDAVWIQRGEAIVGRREVIAGDAWLTGLWPLSSEALETLSSPDFSPRTISGENWSAWPAIDQTGSARSLEIRAETGAVVLFLPLGSAITTPWVDETLERFRAWQQTSATFPELAEVGWLVVSTTPEADSRQKVEQWRKAVMAGAAGGKQPEIDWLTLLPRTDGTVHSALGLPFFETAGQPSASLPLWVIFDRRGVQRVVWQGWEAPLTEWTAILRDR